MKAASEFASPPQWFRDEDGIEWAAPHEAGADTCPWGLCDEMQPFCHTVDGDSADWEDFVTDGTFIKEIN